MSDETGNTYLYTHVENMRLCEIEDALKGMETVATNKKHMGRDDALSMIEDELIATLCIIVRELSHRMRRIDAVKDINP